MNKVFVAILLGALLAFASAAEEPNFVDVETDETDMPQEDVEEEGSTGHPVGDEAGDSKLDAKQTPDDMKAIEEEDVQEEAAAKRRHTGESNTIVGQLNRIRRRIYSELSHKRRRNHTSRKNWNRRVSRSHRLMRRDRSRSNAYKRRYLTTRGKYMANKKMRKRVAARNHMRYKKMRHQKYRELHMVQKIECMIWKLNKHNGKLNRCKKQLAHHARMVGKTSLVSKIFYTSHWTRRTGQRWTIPAKSGRRIQILKAGMCGDSDSGSGPNMFSVRGGVNFDFGAGRKCGQRRNYTWRGRRNNYWLGCLKTPRRNGKYQVKYYSMKKTGGRSRSVSIRFRYHYDWDGMGCRTYDSVSKRKFRDPRSSIRYIIAYRYV
jgi:hypothetical protein